MTLGHMRTFAEEYKINPTVRELALRLTRNLPQKDYMGEVRALWDYVKYNVRYVRDIRGVETIQTPLKTLEFGQGDCDDKATLLSSMLESLGHATRFRAVGFTSNSLCHVLVDVFVGGKWIPLETTEPVAMGWTPPNTRNELIEGLSGLGDIFGSIKKFGRQIDDAAHKIGRQYDDEIGQKVAKPVLKNKYVAPVATAVGTFFPPAAIITVPLALASKAVISQQGKVAAIAKAKRDAEAANIPVADKLYMIDPNTQQVREATALDAGAQLFTVGADGTVTPQLTQTAPRAYTNQKLSASVSPWLIPAGIVLAVLLIRK